jgi:hypothetical protein
MELENRRLPVLGGIILVAASFRRRNTIEQARQVRNGPFVRDVVPTQGRTGDRVRLGTAG